jgi:hypothetical protein
LSTLDHDAALAVVRATSEPIHHLGTSMYMSPDVMAWAAEWGWANPFSFYFAGRGGMLGDVSAEVVQSAFGWFEPNAVKSMFEEGVAVAGTSGAAARMAEAHGLWGQKHLTELEGLDEFVDVAEELVDGLEGSAIPLFVGWRSAPRDESGPGRAAQLIQILREWRGGIHLVATTAVGLSPLEAILSNEGEGQAKFFGWAGPFPSSDDLKRQHVEAEDMTDQLSAAALARVLSPGKYPVFEAGVAAARTAVS